MDAKAVDLAAAAAGHARAVGLVYVTDDEPGITRRLHRRGFAYFDARNKRVRDPEALLRIRKIAIPPAWQEVWICPTGNGHIQATGRDARGRKQYRYHSDFRAVRDESKYDRIVAFATALPRLRKRIDRDMRMRGLPRAKVLATIVHLLDRTLIRVGNIDYARQNGSYGLTTLKNRHVEIEGSALRFEFKAKSGKVHRVELRDRRVAPIVRSCQELPGQQLFRYIDETGVPMSVTSTDVNAYLREATGEDVTAKDFRTWGGTVLAALALTQFPPFEAKVVANANVKDAIAFVANRLSNTPTICRKCYIHPAVLDAYLEGRLTLRIAALRPNGKAGSRHRLQPEEKATLSFLRGLSKRRRKK